MSGSDPDQKDEFRPSSLAVLGAVSALGFELLGFVLSGLFLGHFLDTRYDFAPLGVIVMVLLALMAFGWHAYRVSRRYLLEHGEE